MNNMFWPKILVEGMNLPVLIIITVVSDTRVVVQICSTNLSK